MFEKDKASDLVANAYPPGQVDPVVETHLELGQGERLGPLPVLEVVAPGPLVACIGPPQGQHPRVEHVTRGLVQPQWLAPGVR